MRGTFWKIRNVAGFELRTLDLLDKKIARVLTARNELHKAIFDLFNSDVAEVEGLTAESPSKIKAIPEQPAESEQPVVDVKLNLSGIAEAQGKIDKLAESLKDLPSCLK